MKILGIETSSHLFSLCLMDENALVKQVTKNRSCDPAHRDAKFFDEANMLFDTWHPGDLDAIAVSIGPGMFTSLRVGLGFAKGIYLAHGTPVVGVNTLDVIGNDLSFFPGIVGVVINAFHRELYVALYDQGTCTSDYLLVEIEECRSLLKQASLVVGPGVSLLPDCSQPPPFKQRILFPSAEMVVAHALPRIRAGDYDAVDMLEPFYLKKTDAERLHDTKNAN